MHAACVWHNTGHPFKTVIGRHITKLEMFVGSEVSTADIPLAAYQFFPSTLEAILSSFSTCHRHAVPLTSRRVKIHSHNEIVSKYMFVQQQNRCIIFLCCLSCISTICLWTSPSSHPQRVASEFQCTCPSLCRNGTVKEERRKWTNLH